MSRIQVEGHAGNHAGINPHPSNHRTKLPHPCSSNASIATSPCVLPKSFRQSPSVMNSNGQPAMAGDLLYVQGLSGTNETHVALLHVLPVWSEERRAILRDLILARWIRSVELYGYNTAFLSACTAGMERRWQNLCKYLPNIPTVQVRPKGSSAGFNQP